MDEKVFKLLGTIGLNKNDIFIYLDLLSHNSSSALEISKRTGIHRSNTYDSIRRLVDRGFSSEVITENKKSFIARDPEKIKDYLEYEVDEVNTILPYLKNISKTDESNDEGVSVEKGVFAARESMMELLNLNQPIYMMGISKQVVEIIGLGFLNQFHQERIKKKISIRVIYHESFIDRVKYINKHPLSEARYIPDKYSNEISMFISGNIVYIMLFEKVPTIIKIKNQMIENAYQNYFEMFWKQAKVDK